MRHFSSLFIILILIFLSACDKPVSSDGVVAQSALKRNLNPDISEETKLNLLDGNTTFAFDFYHQVQEADGNVVYSPYSISLAAAMLYGGANGETASQISDALNFTLASEQLHPAFNSLSLDLAQRPKQSEKVDKKNPMELVIANAVWGQKDYAFEQAYLDLLAVNYGAGVRLLDFISAPDPARQEINDWVYEETNGKIKDILAPGSIDPSTRMVLANAIYFKAAWQDAFVEKLTKDSEFTLLDGSQIQVPMMQTDGSIPVRVGLGEGFQILALPYKGELAEMVIILPDVGQFETVEDLFSADFYSSALGSMQSTSLTVYMPKYEFKATYDLTTVLSALGMPLAFDPNQADFSGITMEEQLYAQQAIHSAYILVNEEGTEAAAASLFSMMASALPQEVRIDRPFIFIIRDVPTGTVLFLGRVLNPLVN